MDCPSGGFTYSNTLDRKLPLTPPHYSLPTTLAPEVDLHDQWLVNSVWVDSGDELMSDEAIEGLIGDDFLDELADTPPTAEEIDRLSADLDLVGARGVPESQLPSNLGISHADTENFVARFSISGPDVAAAATSHTNPSLAHGVAHAAAALGLSPRFDDSGAAASGDRTRRRAQRPARAESPAFSEPEEEAFRMLAHPHHLVSGHDPMRSDSDSAGAPMEMGIAVPPRPPIELVAGGSAEGTDADADEELEERDDSWMLAIPPPGSADGDFDSLEHKLKTVVPEAARTLDRARFTQWKSHYGLKFKGAEKKALTEIRRVELSRVYARNTREKKKKGVAVAATAKGKRAGLGAGKTPRSSTALPSSAQQQFPPLL